MYGLIKHSQAEHQKSKYLILLRASANSCLSRHCKDQPVRKYGNIYCNCTWSKSCCYYNKI